VVQGVDVGLVEHAIHGLVVEVGHLRVVFEHELVEDVVDPEPELELSEEGHHLGDPEAFGDVVLGLVQQLQDVGPGDPVAVGSVGGEQGVLVEVVDGVEEALVLAVVVLLDGLGEGVLAHVQNVGAVAVGHGELLVGGHHGVQGGVGGRAGGEPLRPEHQHGLQVAGGQGFAVPEVGVREAGLEEVPPSRARIPPLHQHVHLLVQEGLGHAGDLQVTHPEGAILLLVGLFPEVFSVAIVVAAVPVDVRLVAVAVAGEQKDLDLVRALAFALRPQLLAEAVEAPLHEVLIHVRRSLFGQLVATRQQRDEAFGVREVDLFLAIGPGDLGDFRAIHHGCVHLHGVEHFHVVSAVHI
jgi:hypothetical protein